MATLRPLDIQYGLTLNGTLVLDRERNLAVENASIKNLQVTGTLTAVNSTETYVKDNNILLNSGIEPGTVTTLGTITGGSNYTPGSYRNIPLTVSSGQAGVGATADITVGTNGQVTTVTIVNGGYGYATNTVFSAAAADLDSDASPNGTGFSVPVTAVTAGSAGTDAFITVARGTSGSDVAIRWDETTTDRWQLTNNGTNYFSIYVTDDASTTATANKLVLRDGSGNITVTDVGAVNGTFSGDIAVNGGDITTSSATFNIAQANATTVNIGGKATSITLAGDTPASATTVTVGTNTLNNTLNINGSGVNGTATLGTNVTAGIVNLVTGITTGTVNIATGGASTVNVAGTGGSLIVGTTTGNSTLTIRGNTAAGTATINTNVTTGIVDAFTGITTGTVNLATGGASTTNIGGAAGVVNIGTTAGNSTLTIRGNGTAGTTTLATNVTTGIVDAFTGVTTGTLNLVTGGASTTNIGGAAGVVNIGTTSGNSTLTIRGNGAGGSTTIATNVTTGTANIFTSVTGTVNIGGVASNVYIGTQGAVSGSTTTVATVSQTTTDTFVASTFRSCEYLIQITQGSSYQISKILLVHDGTTAYITEYGTLTSGASVLGTLDADVSGGNVRLLVTMGSAASATVKVFRQAIVV